MSAEKLNALDLLGQNQQTFEDSQRQFKKATERFQKTNNFYLKEHKKYNVKVLPLKPEPDNPDARAGWEYPYHSFFLKIERSNGTFMYRDVIRPDYAGIDGDLLAKYTEIGIKQAKDTGNNDALKKLEFWKTGLKYSVNHACYVVDMDDYDKSDMDSAIKLWKLRRAQYKDIHEARESVWEQLRANNPKALCPMTNPLEHYNLFIDKQKDRETFSLNTIGGAQSLDVEIAEKLLSMPSIPESTFVYNRYALEATHAFLLQYDVDVELSVCDTEEYKAEYSKIEAQLDPSDTSSFSLDGDDDEDDGESGGSILLDDLYDEADRISDEGLGEKSEESANLRTKISSFIQQEGLDVKIAGQSNDELLDLIEEEITKPKPKPEPEKKTRRRRRQ